ncbi:hypothetical protein Bbelb_244470 [Branchiostoma belcheri]|nr:hypothetical protein Bbelb_244470 [Branchiostoma belcheri]
MDRKLVYFRAGISPTILPCQSEGLHVCCCGPELFSRPNLNAPSTAPLPTHRAHDVITTVCGHDDVDDFKGNGPLIIQCGLWSDVYWPCGVKFKLSRGRDVSGYTHAADGD